MSKATIQSKTASQEKMEKVVALTNPPRITKDEKELLKSVFGLEPHIYTALRDCFFGFDLDDYQKDLLKRITPVRHLIKRLFLPEISKEIAFGQNFDLWQTQDIKNSNADTFESFKTAKLLILKSIETGLKRLEDTDLQGISLKIDEHSDFPTVLARNGFISYIDQQIRFLMQFSISDLLTEAEIQAMLRANSTK